MITQTVCRKHLSRPRVPTLSDFGKSRSNLMEKNIFLFSPPSDVLRLLCLDSLDCLSKQLHHDRGEETKDDADGRRHRQTLRVCVLWWAVAGTKLHKTQMSVKRCFPLPILRILILKTSIPVYSKAHPKLLIIHVVYRHRFGLFWKVTVRISFPNLFEHSLNTLQYLLFFL